MQDILDTGYDRAGIGVASDGSRVFVTVLLSETRDSVLRAISGANPVPILEGQGVLAPSEGNYITLE